MKKILATAIVVSMSTVASYAGGWGGGHSQSLINVSPSVDVDDVNVLSGILNGNAILNGNNVSDILSGNQTGVGNGVGILGGIGSGIIGGNGYKLKKH